MVRFERLRRDFFWDHPKNVAPRLLGKYLVLKKRDREIISKIVEVESYGGYEDKACHIGRFGRTRRTEILFGEVGRAYIYSVHINTRCLNIVSHRQGQGGGVLVRSLQLLEGGEYLLRRKKNISSREKDKLLSGPGRICRILELDNSWNGEDLVAGERLFLLRGESIRKEQIVSCPRINIPYAGISCKWHWRFLIKNNRCVSFPLKRG